MSHFIDLTRKKFGRLTVLKRIENTEQGGTQWLCECDCGKIVPIPRGNLMSGNSESCGCLRRDLHLGDKNPRFVHGMSKEGRDYHAWKAMLRRVRAERTYIERGITVCDEWKNDPERFINYVRTLPHYGEPGREIDRKNNNDNYQPGNIRWATRKEQNANRSKYRQRKDTGIKRPWQKIDERGSDGRIIHITTHIRNTLKQNQ